MNRLITKAELAVVEWCLSAYRQQAANERSAAVSGYQVGGLPHECIMLVAAVQVEREDPKLRAEINRAERELEAASERLRDLRRRLHE